MVATTVALLLPAPSLAAPSAAAPSAMAATAGVPSTTDYPWAGLTYRDGADQWGMAYGQCVSFVAWMIYKNLGGAQHPAGIPSRGWFPSDGLAKGPVRNWWGNAGSWNITAASAGYTVDRTPRAGSVAQWINGGNGGSFAVGHVAYVTAVHGDGSIDIAQYNLREDGRYSTMHMTRGGATDTSNGNGPFFVAWPDYFLHIGDANVAKPQAPRLSGSPALVYGDEQHVFGRDVAGRLHHWFWSPGGGGVKEQDWGGGLAGDPVGFVYGDEQHVFGRDVAGRLHHWFWSPAGGGVKQQDWGGALAAR
ncbi:CHAP domain-containing protein [Dactylosporangium sp. CA-092794]|uniref:CHAP domain-containing protein n=1 Tax=Dactylosporangium sp. CA-092794 TaxID=3239929 RepID=UPI003D8CC391